MKLNSSLLAATVLLALVEQGDTPPVPSLPAPAFAELARGEVLRVVDGDTLSVDVAGTPTTIRLVGVDTPETVDPRKPVQEYGKEASAFLSNLLLGESVYVEIGEGVADKYGRTLAYLYRAPDGLFVNAEIVRQGYGHAYTTYPFKHLEDFRALEQRARQFGKGLWGSRDPTAKGSTEARPEEPESEPPSVTVYVTRTGSKYHRAGCRYLSKSKIPMPLEDARKQYGPCSVCGPPR